MTKLRFDAAQHFTCQGCARCCQRWEVAVTAAEMETYRKAKAEWWFRESDSGTEGTQLDPFLPIAGHAGAFRIRRRSDGSCGFLSRENRCRIHEELGGDRKPLTCRLFPFRFHPAEREVVVTASFSCPTVTADSGATVGSQVRDLEKLQVAWSRQYPEPAASVLFAEDHPVTAATAAAFRAVLRQILDRANTGARDLRENVARIARYCEDLTRHRVLKLPPDDFVEYLRVTGKFAVANEKPAVSRPASRLSRLQFRGFLFAVLAVQMRLKEGQGSGFRGALRWKLFRLMAHLHGMGPGVGTIHTKHIRRAVISFDDPEISSAAYHYLRSCIETLGTGRLPMIDQLGLAGACLNAAFALAAMQTGSEKGPRVTGEALARGLMEVSDAEHAEMQTSHFAGVESLFQLASL